MMMILSLTLLTALAVHSSATRSGLALKGDLGTQPQLTLGAADVVHLVEQALGRLDGHDEGLGAALAAVTVGMAESSDGRITEDIQIAIQEVVDQLTVHVSSFMEAHPAGTQALVDAAVAQVTTAHSAAQTAQTTASEELASWTSCETQGAACQDTDLRLTWHQVTMCRLSTTLHNQCAAHGSYESDASDAQATVVMGYCICLLESLPSSTQDSTDGAVLLEVKSTCEQQLTLDTQRESVDGMMDPLDCEGGLTVSFGDSGSDVHQLPPAYCAAASDSATTCVDFSCDGKQEINSAAVCSLSAGCTSVECCS